MRVLMDACILFPTVMREVLIGAAGQGGFTPLWSARILQEWAYAARKLGPEAEGIARAEIAHLGADWPDASIAILEGAEAALNLPDRDDRHVLAAAIAGEADCILTRNRSDFPIRALGQHGLLRRDPDEFLLELAHEGRIDMAQVVLTVQSRAIAASGRAQPMRKLLKRAGLPRLAKHFAALNPDGSIPPTAA